MKNILKRIEYWFFFIMIALTLPIWWWVGYTTRLEMIHNGSLPVQRERKNDIRTGETHG